MIRLGRTTLKSNSKPKNNNTNDLQSEFSGIYKGSNLNF